MSSRKLFVIDIGTHKLEELYLLFAPSWSNWKSALKWSIKGVLATVLRFDRARLKTVISTLKLFVRKRDTKRFADAKFICVEPNVDVFHPASMRFQKNHDVDYYPIAILGHDAEENVEIAALNMYKDSLSSSVYDKEKLTSVSRLACIGMKFDYFVDLLKKDFGLSNDHDVLLRMNCEGTELGIVRALHKSDLNVIGIIGSLADVRKIHGEDEYAEMLSILEDMNVGYQYLVASNPNSWQDALRNPSVADVVFE